LISVAELVGTSTNDTYRLSCCVGLALHFLDLHVKVKEKSLIGKKFKRKKMSEGNEASQLCPLLVQQENEARGSACQNRLQLDPKHY